MGCEMDHSHLFPRSRANAERCYILYIHIYSCGLETSAGAVRAALPPAGSPLSWIFFEKKNSVRSLFSSLFLWGAVAALVGRRAWARRHVGGAGVGVCMCMCMARAELSNDPAVARANTRPSP
eukprot:scaffold21262_cov129-Isochrysis_galbana.AAC.1